MFLTYDDQLITVSPNYLHNFASWWSLFYLWKIIDNSHNNQ